MSCPCRRFCATFSHRRGGGAKLPRTPRECQPFAFTLGPDSERYVLANRDEVGLAAEAIVWTDVAEFERCIEQERLEDALDLCGGELLAGLDDDWVYERREAHRERVASVLARLAARAESDRDHQAAIGFTRRQVALDPLAEEPQRDLMRRLAPARAPGARRRAHGRVTPRLGGAGRIAPPPAPPPLR